MSDHPHARAAYDAHYPEDNDPKTGDAICVCGWRGWDLLWHKAEAALEAERAESSRAYAGLEQVIAYLEPWERMQESGPVPLGVVTNVLELARHFRAVSVRGGEPTQGEDRP